MLLLIVDKYYLSWVVYNAEFFFGVDVEKRKKNADISETAAMLSAGSKKETRFMIYSD